MLELSQFLKTLSTRKDLSFVINAKPKYPKRSLRWSIQEFMSSLETNVSPVEYLQLKAFIDDISSMDGVLLQTGKRKKIPTLGIGFEWQGNQFPLNVDAAGKASIAYYNVNAKPPYPPQMNEETIRRIRNLLGEPEKQWHKIKAPNITVLVEKLRAIVKLMLEK